MKDVMLRRLAAHSLQGGLGSAIEERDWLAELRGCHPRPGNFGNLAKSAARTCRLGPAILATWQSGFAGLARQFWQPGKGPCGGLPGSPGSSPKSVCQLAKIAMPACQNCQGRLASSPQVRLPACQNCQGRLASSPQVRLPACQNCQPRTSLASPRALKSRHPTEYLAEPSLEAPQPQPPPPPPSLPTTRLPACQNCQPFPDCQNCQPLPLLAKIALLASPSPAPFASMPNCQPPSTLAAVPTSLTQLSKFAKPGQ